MNNQDQGGALSAGEVTQKPNAHAAASERIAGIPRSILKEAWSLALLLAAVFVVRSSIFSIYVIPTGSMLPTIKIDDRVFANKLAFGLMLPFGERQVISWSSPQRGDIVLFKSPMEDQTFVKRVVGIGGDVLSFEAGVLKINGELAHEELQSDRSVMTDMGGGEAAESRNLFRERVVDKPEHYILKSRTGGLTLYESRTFQVPEGKIFLMGDNRDGSNDSRSWGVIDATSVYGRASFVLYSTERSEEFWPQFRTDRFFKSFD
jgi:signal peptidase I